jgi:hypothetical protein
LSPLGFGTKMNWEDGRFMAALQKCAARRAGGEAFGGSMRMRLAPGAARFWLGKGAGLHTLAG